MMKELETLSGTGRLLDDSGKDYGPHEYRLTVWQRMHDDGHGGHLEGLRSIEGRVILSGLEGYDRVVNDESLVLELVDGRKLPFFFVSSNGKIAARGDLK